MIELYGSATPSAHTIAIMLEEAGLPYTVFPVSKDSAAQFDFDFLESTPNRNFPLILDRDGPNNKPLVLCETGAILLYLAEKSGKLFSDQPREKFDVLQWLLFENSKLGPTVSNNKHFMYHTPEPIPYAVKRFNTETKRIFSIFEKQLAENEFIAGDYSIADIASFPWVKEFERFGMTAEEFPHIQSWVAKMSERETVQKGLDVMNSLKA